MTNEEKLQSFRTITMEAVRQKAANELDSYQASLDKTFESYKESKEAQAKQILSSEKDKLGRENNKVISLEHIHMKQEYSQKHDELKGKIFSEVWDLLAKFTDTRHYEKLLIKKIQKIMEFAKGEPVKIFLDPADIIHKKSLEVATGAQIYIGDTSFGGGIRAVLPERNVLLDESFKTQIKEIMENFSFMEGESHGK